MLSKKMQEALNGQINAEVFASYQYLAMAAVFEAALEHERRVTGMINQLMDLAIKESDHATASFLKWFVDEQVEEEATADMVIQDLKRIGDSAEGLFILD